MLFTTWGKKNRIIQSPLCTTFTREKIEHDVQGYSTKLLAWKYNRLRTKQYSYIGLTEAAAKACVVAMNRLYHRLICDQRVHWGSATSQDSNYVYPEYFNGYPGDANEGWNRVLEHYEVKYMRQYKSVVVGSAVATRDGGDSGAYTVTVNVSEELSAYYVPGYNDLTTDNVVWNAFETNPDAKYLEFVGMRDTNGEEYDDGDVGYGSPA